MGSLDRGIMSPIITELLGTVCLMVSPPHWVAVRKVNGCYLSCQVDLLMDGFCCVGSSKFIHLSLLGLFPFSSIQLLYF